MDKIKTLSELSSMSNQMKKEEESIALVTGCFDILHLSHIELFRFAKEHADILIVMIENDESIRLSKGKNRPVFSQQERVQTLVDLGSIDDVFVNEKVYKFDANEIDSIAFILGYRSFR